MNKKVVRKSAWIVSLGLVASQVVQASPIAVDFTVTSQNAYGGFAAGTTGSGSFSFDDSVGTFYDNTMGVTPSHLTFDWLGSSWDESNVRIFSLTFDAHGVLSGWGIGGVPGTCGLNCVDAAVNTTDFWAYIGEWLPSGGVALKLSNEFGLGGGHISWNVRSESVPEPATFGMFAIGLLGAGLAGRKRKC